MSNSGDIIDINEDFRRRVSPQPDTGDDETGDFRGRVRIPSDADQAKQSSGDDEMTEDFRVRAAVLPSRPVLPKRIRRH